MSPALMQRGAAASRFKPALLADLDEPVQRYLAHAIRYGAGLMPGVRLAMEGRIKAGAWLPFTARQECDGRSFCWRARVACGPVTVLDVVDRFADGAGLTDGVLLGRWRVLHADDEDTARSAAGRAALESVFAPASLMPGRGVSWRAESDEEIVATFDLPPERPEVHLRIDDLGVMRSAVAQRWGKVDGGGCDYIPCGCEVRAERRFGDLVIPSSVTVGWWFGTPRYAPFFEADVRELARAS